MSTIPRYQPHYSATIYRQWEGDWELIGGTAVSMTPSPFGPHQLIASRLIQQIANKIDALGRNDFHVLPELDWEVTDDTVVRPDVMLICGPIPTEYLRSAPLLIVEVLSASTAEKDRTAKFDLYESQRVPYYVIVDPERKAFDVYSLHDDRYIRLNHATDELIVLHFPTLEMDLELESVFRQL